MQNYLLSCTGIHENGNLAISSRAWHGKRYTRHSFHLNKLHLTDCFVRLHRCYFSTEMVSRTPRAYVNYKSMTSNIVLPLDICDIFLLSGEIKDCFILWSSSSYVLIIMAAMLAQIQPTKENDTLILKNTFTKKRRSKMQQPDMLLILSVLESEHLHDICELWIAFREWLTHPPSSPFFAAKLLFIYCNNYLLSGF